MKIRHNAKTNTFTLSNISVDELHQIYWAIHHRDTPRSWELRDLIKNYLKAKCVQYFEKIVNCK